MTDTEINVLAETTLQCKEKKLLHNEDLGRLRWNQFIAAISANFDFNHEKLIRFIRSITEHPLIIYGNYEMRENHIMGIW